MTGVQTRVHSSACYLLGHGDSKERNKEPINITLQPDLVFLIGTVSLFKGTSTFTGYLMPNPSLFVYLFMFYGISNFVGYLMPNPFLYK